MTINEIFSSLRASYIEWSHVLVNPRFIRGNNVISWEGYSGRRFNAPVTSTYVAKLADEGQYTFQVIEDGSIIQIYYLFDRRGEISNANLAFYYSGETEYSINSQVRELPDSKVNEEQLVDSIEFTEQFENHQEFQTVGWLRLDYSPNEYRGVLHSQSHLHFSLFPYSRFVVDGVPNPAQFIEFILSMCYPKIYKDKRLDENGLYIDVNKMLTFNSPNLLIPNKDIYPYTIHFCIPWATVHKIPEIMPIKKKRR
ncbi:MAG: DUF2290 domain-containing protein [Anaerolineales bacterium]|nr:DUF2290 domain-containing protein [Anaerolineales bacterium]